MKPSAPNFSEDKINSALSAFDESLPALALALSWERWLIP
jgi:hypothetical protein